MNKIRLGVFVTHPVYYHVPLWRGLAQMEDIDLTVHYFSDHGVRRGVDPGFGVPVAWDIPLLSGYRSTFLSRDADLTRPARIRLSGVRRFLKSEGFNCVLIHGYTHGFERQLATACRRENVPCVLRGELTNEGAPRGRLKAALRSAYLRWFYKHIAAFCVVGEQARRHLVPFGVPNERMFFSPYSIDATRFESCNRPEERDSARRKHRIDANDFVLLFSGKFIERKAAQLMARAAARLSSEDRKRLWLVFVGDGPLRDQVRRDAQQAVAEKVLMPGFINQSGIAEYLCLADAFVLPSQYDTWGLVVNEAMSAGLPALVSDRVGCRSDLVIPGKTGFVFRRGDERELSGQIGTLLADRGLAAQMGQNAREQVSRYSIAASVEGLHAAVKACRARPPHTREVRPPSTSERANQAGRAGEGAASAA